MPTFRKHTTTKTPRTNSRKFTIRKATPRKIAMPRVEKEPTLIAESAVKEHARKTLSALEESLASTTGHARAESKENAVYKDDSDDLIEFNGISDVDEQKQFFGEVVGYERKKAKVVEEQLKMLERDREEERKKLEKEIRTLKEELHRTTPLHDNKFFSLSKSLRDAITEIERIANDQGIDTSVTPEPLPTPTTELPVLEKVVEAPKPVEKVVEAPIKVPQVAPPVVTEEKKSLSKKKALITGVSAVVLLLVVSSAFSGMFTGKSKVDQKIVDSYLSAQAGKVEGTSTEVKTETDPSQAEVTFEQSDWEEFKDPTFGILLQFPKNAVKAVRTDSNVTFIRKTGYLFKIQRIETALTLDEYWKQIKATSLNYASSEDKFKGKPALKLELQDMADYPGDRYLVKEGSFIYDIWYATPSKIFTADDIKRAEKMLASLSVVGAK